MVQTSWTDLIAVVRGSVIDCDTDAIVNAANARLRGGGGVDGAIHAKAGAGMLQELQRLHSGWASPGDVVVTRGHGLPQQYVFHAVGPVWRGGGEGEEAALAQCYRACIQHAVRLGLRSVGFCSISTGTYGFPLELAAPIALESVRATLATDPGALDRIVFAMYLKDEFLTFTRCLSQMTKT